MCILDWSSWLKDSQRGCRAKKAPCDCFSQKQTATVTVNWHVRLQLSACHLLTEQQ